MNGVTDEVCLFSVKGDDLHGFGQILGELFFKPKVRFGASCEAVAVIDQRGQEFEPLSSEAFKLRLHWY